MFASQCCYVFEGLHFPSVCSYLLGLDVIILMSSKVSSKESCHKYVVRENMGDEMQLQQPTRLPSIVGILSQLHNHTIQQCVQEGMHTKLDTLGGHTQKFEGFNTHRKL